MTASHTPILDYDSADEYRPEPEPEPQPLPYCNGSVRIGIHTSIAGDISHALESAHNLGCNALQIFSASPRMWLPWGEYASPEMLTRRDFARAARN